MDWLNSMDWQWMGSAALRLLIAFVLGALVGYEREQASRPAGFRTHILVSIGAALAMLTGEYMSLSGADVDPTRLGAQVISGIGFLGAGTIIRNGNSVRGLTTAASLWAVACIGLAAGSGFVPGALIAATLTFVILIALKSVEKRISSRRGNINLQVVLDHYGPDVIEILRLAEQHQIQVRRIQLLPPEEDEEHRDRHIHLRLSLQRGETLSKMQLVESIYQLPSVLRVLDD